MQLMQPQAGAAAWTSFTPNTDGVFVVEDGALAGHYSQVGKHVWYRVEFTFGADTYIDGTLTFATPVGAARGIDGTGVGTATISEPSTGKVSLGAVSSGGVGTTFVVSGVDGDAISAGAPGDTIVVTGDYETT